jgi:Ca2+-transporting ATPase
VRGVVFYAILIAAVTIVAFFWIGDDARGRTAAFMTLALAQALHLGNGRSRDAVVSPRRAFGNRWAVAALCSVFALQAFVVAVPSLGKMLGTVSLGARDWGIVLTLAVLPALIGQAIKLLHHRNGGRPSMA